MKGSGVTYGMRVTGRRHDMTSKRTDGVFSLEVWLFNPRRRRGVSSPKLQRSWGGPCEIVTRVNDVIYILQDQEATQRIGHELSTSTGWRLTTETTDRKEIRFFELVAPKRCLSTSSCLEWHEDLCIISHGVTKIVHQDLIIVPSAYALAHCIASDFQMSRGNARVFRSKFGGIQNLELRGPWLGKPGNYSGRIPLYLVTKRWSNKKPTYSISRSASTTPGTSG